MKASNIIQHLKEIGDPERAKVSQRFFKTTKGEYGEGDVFVGLRVPEIRKLAKQYHSLPLSEVIRLLHSPIHEARLLAILILIFAYIKGDKPLQAQIFDLYLQNTSFINNWDLVDASAEHIVGAHLRDRKRSPLHALAKSDLLWDRRIAVMATFHYIKQGEFDETLHIAKRLLDDTEDLIHKAVGWMLREIGKRDSTTEVEFLKKYYRRMPRTMLRYAIEKFPEELRQRYLKGEV